MAYEYSGYLKGLVSPPDPETLDGLDSIVFRPEELKQWSINDLPNELEWQRIPVTCKPVTDGVRLEGRFNDIRQIDNLSPDDPSFWVAISSINRRIEAFPIDTARYPIAEITYRCCTPNARPAWVWLYPGGEHFDGLTPSQEWHTVARQIRHQEFPEQIDGVVLRMYATSRSVESMEIASVRFRAMTKEEAAAVEAENKTLEPMRGRGPLDLGGVKHYPLLDEFYPFGTHMDAGSSKRMAAMLGASLAEYWSLVFEDLARHHHNCVALEKVDRLTTHEWRELMALAIQFGIRFYVIHELPMGSPQGYYEEFVDNHIRPYATSDAILAWSLMNESGEQAFRDLLQIRKLIEEVDPHHPVVIMLRGSKGLSLISPFMPVTSLSLFASHNPWEAGRMVKTHLPLCGGQHLWFCAPSFTYATDTPEWHTCPEMRLMLNLALIQGARGWFTYAYHNDPIWVRGSCQRTLTGPFLAFSDLWSELGQRVEQCGPLTPLFLHAVRERTIDSCFKAESRGRANAQLPQGIAATTNTRLCGTDFELFCVVSNDIREMTTVNIDIAREIPEDMALFDMTDYIKTREWTPAVARRHLEMFPGQLAVMLMARHDVCDYWRSVVTARMLENDRRTVSFDLALARAYGLNISNIEQRLDTVSGEGHPEDVHAMRRVRDDLLSLIYESPAIYESRSSIIEATAAVCACDGSLCRLLGRGKSDLARQLGFKVIPLAREFTSLRLESRRGQGAAILPQCKDLAKRALELLAEIRSVS